MWGAATVWRFLTSETYAGVFHYGKWESYEKGSKREVRPLDQQIAVKVPAIVDREIWEAAQERRGHNKRISGTKHYLLRGLVTCGCGRKMRGGTCYRANHLRYRCNSDQTYFAELETEQRNCHEKTVNGKVLESVVWDYVVSILADPVRFETAWRKAQAAEQSSLAPKRERLESIHELIKHCEQEAAETAEALKKAKGLILEKLEADQDAINDRYNKLTAEREKLTAKLQGSEQFTDESFVHAMQFRAEAIEGLKSPTFDDKRLCLGIAPSAGDGERGTCYNSLRFAD